MTSEPLDPKIVTIDAFLQALRVSLNFITLYSRQHKSFLVSVKDLKVKTDALLLMLNPVKVFFTVDSLSVDNTVFSKKALYSELARFFHARKIHYIQLSPGISEEEFALALEKAALAVRELFRQGGLRRLLDQAGVTHFITDELDYSAFLRDAGEEAVDVWSFVLNEAVHSEDAQKLYELARTFDAVIAKLRLRHFLDDVALIQNVHAFLEAVRSQDKALYEQCTKKIFKLILVDKAELTEEDIPRLQGFLQYLSGKEMAQTLLDEVTQDEHFDRDNFSLFSKLIEHQKHAEIAEAITEELEKKRAVTVDPKAARKLHDLFTVDDNPVLKEMYRKVATTLGSLELVKPGGSAFDSDEARVDYHAILSFLLATEKDEKRLTDIAVRILGEWEILSAQENEETVYSLCRSAVAAGDLFRANSELGQLHKQCSLFVEDAVFAGKRLERFEGFLETVRIPGRLPQEYFKLIVEEGRADPSLLRLFLRFYSDQAEVLGVRLAERGYDSELCSAMVDALVNSGSPQAGRVLEALYAPANDFIRSEIVKAIGQLPDIDTGFLSSVIREGGYSLKKQALAILLNDPQVADAALNVFFGHANEWARNNLLLLENLQIIEELGARSAAEHVRYLYKTTPFWNIPLRSKAQRVYRRLQ